MLLRIHKTESTIRVWSGLQQNHYATVRLILLYCNEIFRGQHCEIEFSKLRNELVICTLTKTMIQGSRSDSRSTAFYRDNVIEGQGCLLGILLNLAVPAMQRISTARESAGHDELEEVK